MTLRPLQDSDLELAGSWLAQKDIYQWLDFDNGPQVLTPMTLKIMSQRDSHLLRLFTAETDDMPAGIVAFSNINRRFKTAMPWCLLGNKRYSAKGLVVRAVAELLSFGFNELGLEAVNAWTVAENFSAIRLLERLHFRRIGVQRRCHYIDGRACDRILFDLLACEHKGN